MPTYPRKHQLSGSLIYHVFNRSSNRQPIFHSNGDFIHFMDILKRYIDKFYIKLYHWVIMSNHYHLLFEIADPWHISSMMAGMAKAYTTYHHARHQTSGYLWQGRFKSQPIQKERYLLACARYIERNPVKAQIVEKAPIYMYSSALYYCSGIKDLITSEDPTYRDFGQNLEQRRNSYRQFLSMCDPKEEKLFDNMNAPQGDEWFSKKLIKHKGRYMPRIKGGPMNTQRSPTINSFCNKLHPN